MKKTASGILPFVVVDRQSTIPLNQQIYDALRSAILSGSIGAGQRVPSTRVLAAEIGVSRFPVLSAYSQLLAEGYLTSRIGSGAVVNARLPERYLQSKLADIGSQISTPPRRNSQQKNMSAKHRDKPAWLRGRGAFHVGEVAFDAFPHEVWSGLVTRNSRHATVDSLRYGDTAGLLALREEVAAYLRTSRAVMCDVEQVLITSGAQQALDLCARVLTKSGDSVWVEDPGYLPAREVFAQRSCQLIPVPIDEHGLRTDLGIQQCSKAKAAVVTPSHQFPLGVTLSRSRRQELLEWAERERSWVIEDDYDSEYRYDTSPLPSLQGLRRDSRVIYIGTFSKVIFPSLRLGYVVVPPVLASEFIRMRSLADSSPPVFFQKVTADFLSEGHFSRHLRRTRALYQARREMLISELTAKLGEVQIFGDPAGLFLTIGIPSGRSDVELAESAAKRNLSVWPLSTCYLQEPRRQGFVLGFASSNEANIRAGVDVVAQLLRSP